MIIYITLTQLLFDPDRNCIQKNVGTENGTVFKFSGSVTLLAHHLHRAAAVRSVFCQVS
jgi:hypothetical protein